LNGVEFVLALGTDKEFGGRTPGGWKIQTSAEWMRKNFGELQFAGDRFQVGQLQQVVGTGPQRKITLAPSGKSELCVGFSPVFIGRASARNHENHFNQMGLLTFLTKTRPHSISAPAVGQFYDRPGRQSDDFDAAAILSFARMQDIGQQVIASFLAASRRRCLWPRSSFITPRSRYWPGNCAAGDHFPHATIPQSTLEKNQ